MLGFYPTDREWIGIPWGEKCFLQVFDIPETRGTDPKTLIAFNGQTITGNHLKASFLALPTQKPGSSRIYVSENLGDRKEFRTHIDQLLPAVFLEDEHYHRAVPSFLRLASQWGSSTGSLAWASTSYGMRATVESNKWSRPSYFLSRLMAFSASVRVCHDKRGCNLSK